VQRRVWNERKNAREEVRDKFVGILAYLRRIFFKFGECDGRSVTRVVTDIQAAFRTRRNQIGIKKK